MAKNKNNEEKIVEKKEVVKKDTKPKKKKEKKENLWVRFRIFWHGVGSEFKKIHWPSKYDLVKYSLAVIIFVILLSMYFYIITTLFNLLLKLFA